MYFTYQFILPQDVWDDFSKRLTNYDSSAPRGIDRFLALATQNMDIKQENGDIIVESKNIDEDAIIAALLSGEEPNCNRYSRMSFSHTRAKFSYHIHTSSSIDASKFQYNQGQDAEIDSYQSHLVTHPKRIFAYCGTDTQYYPKSA